MAIGDNLRALRNSKHKTQKYMADCFNVSRHTIEHLENHRHLPSIAILKQYKEYFNVTIDEIVSDNLIINQKQKSNESSRI